MWEFFGKVLETGGVVAVAFGALGAGFAFVVRALWLHNQSLHRQLSEDRAKYTAALERLSREHADALSSLQERRITEAKAVIERFVEHVQKMDRALDRISTSLSVLVEVSKGPGRG